MELENLPEPAGLATLSAEVLDGVVGQERQLGKNMGVGLESWLSG